MHAPNGSRHPVAWEELRRPKPNARVVEFVAAQPLEQLYVRSASFAEIRCGPDLIIAASALQHGLTVVTRDVRDYAKAKVPLLNPWKPLA